jgi:hypothetical protein
MEGGVKLRTSGGRWYPRAPVINECSQRETTCTIEVSQQTSCVMDNSFRVAMCVRAGPPSLASHLGFVQDADIASN